MDTENNQPKWRYRRLSVFLILLFCILEIGYLTLYGEDTRLNETIANGVLLLMASVTGSYIFGASWENKK